MIFLCEIIFNKSILFKILKLNIKLGVRCNYLKILVFRVNFLFFLRVICFRFWDVSRVY